METCFNTSKMNSLAFLLISLLVLLSREADACPSDCFCDGAPDIYCSNLTAIPSDLPNTTRALYAVKSSLNSLTEGAFSAYPLLESLVLTDCQIESIEENAFSGLTRLTTLDLKKNGIQRLQSDVFDGLEALSDLGLQHNAITTIEARAFNGLTLRELDLANNEELHEISDMAFEGASMEILKLYGSRLDGDALVSLRALAPNLRVLWLQDNQISLDLPSTVFEDFRFTVLNLNNNGITKSGFLQNVICTNTLSLRGNPVGPLNLSSFEGLRNIQELELDETAFSNVEASFFNHMSHLRKLSLSNNGITSLSEKLRPLFDQLEWLNIDNNNLHCNCELIWLKRWVASSNEARRHPIDCVTPRQENILVLAESVMTCLSPTINRGFKRNWNISLDSTAFLTCFGEGDPAPTIEWVPPQGPPVIVEPPYNKSISVNKAILHLETVTDQTQGVYTCNAYNQAGNASASFTVDTYQGNYVIADPTNNASDQQPMSFLAIAIIVYTILPTIRH